MKIPYAKVDCSGRELELVAEVLSSGWLTTAKKTKALEDGIGEYVGSTHSLAVNSCTSALHLALDAVGVGPSDITCLSFYANKTMTTGEGGMLLTNNDGYAKRVKLMRLHGINKDVWDRFTIVDTLLAL